MSRLIQLATAASLVLSLGACQEETNDEATLRLVEEGFELTTEVADIFCDCWDAFDLEGVDSQRECVDRYVRLPSEQRCIKEAYLEDAEAAKIYLECWNELQDDLVACMDARLSCGDPQAAGDCFEDRDVGAQRCIELPESIDRDLGNCFEG